MYDDTYYLGLRYQYRKYSEDLTFSSGDGPYTLNPYTIYKDLAFIYGYQYATEIDNLFEDYLGPSLRFIEENEASYDFNSAGGQNIYATEYRERNSIGFLMGVKIGYTF
ncbi:MAG: hypothetical protein U5L96_19505 [Owenweeksia sp.]|nr:hypothetical protein [Owenweeksia sp.]